MKKTAILFVIISVLFGCNKKTENVAKSAKDCLLESVTDSVESLIFWTSDTVCSQNPELVKLLDPLYKHVRSDSFPSSMKKELEWMEQYRNQLCTYYDTNHLGSDTIASYAKADTVLNLADRLFDADDDWSTMGMIVRNSTKCTFDVCRIYGTFGQLLDCVKEPPISELLYKEFQLSDSIEGFVQLISANLTRMRYWGGSIVGVISTNNHESITEARWKMYQNQLDMIRDIKWEAKGVVPSCAVNLLIDCCNKVLLEDDISHLQSIDSPFSNEAEKESYIESYKNTKSCINDLRPLLKEWIGIWNKLDYELMSDGSRHCSELVATSMLIEWANTISYIY